MATKTFYSNSKALLSSLKYGIEYVNDGAVECAEIIASELECYRFALPVEDEDLDDDECCFECDGQWLHESGNTQHYTAIGQYEDSGQIYADEVQADSLVSAMQLVAEQREQLPLVVVEGRFEERVNIAFSDSYSFE